MPAEDMVKLIIERDVQRARWTEADALKAKEEIETGKKVAIPPYVRRSPGYTPQAFELHERDQGVVMTVTSPAYGQFVADARNYTIRPFGKTGHVLTENEQLRSRFRQPIFRNHVSLAEVADLFDVDSYKLLGYLTEDKYEHTTPTRKMVARLENHVYGRVAA
ncbi:hypothetical protein BBX50_18250 [Ensifer sp. LC11]|nr:hypothetical protein BBX50_18250 [Ensifer sp. LC11]